MTYVREFGNTINRKKFNQLEFINLLLYNIIFFSWEKETIESSLKIFKFDIDICHFLRYNLCFIAPVEKAREQRVERNKKSTGNVKKRSTVIWRIDVCKINERNHFAFK